MNNSSPCNDFSLALRPSRPAKARLPPPWQSSPALGHSQPHQPEHERSTLAGWLKSGAQLQYRRAVSSASVPLPPNRRSREGTHPGVRTSVCCVTLGTLLDLSEPWSCSFKWTLEKSLPCLSHWVLLWLLHLFTYLGCAGSSLLRVGFLQLQCALSSWTSPVAQKAKASACNAGDLGLIPGSGRFPGGGNGNPLQYSCLENPMDGGAWWATAHGVAKSQTRLSNFTFTFSLLGFSSWRLLWMQITSSRAQGLSCPVAYGIFPDQGQNPSALHWQVASQPLDYQGSPVSALSKLL